MVKVITKDEAGGANHVGAPIEITDPISTVPPTEAERIERARQIAGYLPPSAYKNPYLVKTAMMKANQAMDSQFNQSNLDMERRIYIARRAAGYTVNSTHAPPPITYQNSNPNSRRAPAPMPPVPPIAATPDMNERMERARKAAGYDGSIHVQKKTRVASKPKKKDANQAAPVIADPNDDMETRMRKAREAAGYFVDTPHYRPPVTVAASPFAIHYHEPPVAISDPPVTPHLHEPPVTVSDPLAEAKAEPESEIGASTVKQEPGVEESVEL